MCKDGQPCPEMNDAKGDIMGRIEMVIVLAELFEAHKLPVPAGAVAMLDIVGPIMMDGLKKAKGWDGMQMAQAIIKQKRKLFEQQGLTPPSHPLEVLVEMLGELAGEAKKREMAEGIARKENGAKQAEAKAAAAPEGNALDDLPPELRELLKGLSGGAEMHVVIVRGSDDEQG